MESLAEDLENFLTLCHRAGAEHPRRLFTLLRDQDGDDTMNVCIEDREAAFETLRFLCYYDGHSLETLVYATSLLDRFIDRIKVRVGTVRIVVTAVYYIAVKATSPHANTVSNKTLLQDIVTSPLTHANVNEVLRMQEMIFLKLQGKLTVVSHYHVLHNLLDLMESCVRPRDFEFAREEMSRKLELSLHFLYLMQYSPATLVLSIAQGVLEDWPKCFLPPASSLLSLLLTAAQVAVSEVVACDRDVGRMLREPVRSPPCRAWSKAFPVLARPTPLPTIAEESHSPTTPCKLRKEKRTKPLPKTPVPKKSLQDALGPSMGLSSLCWISPDFRDAQ